MIAFQPWSSAGTVSLDLRTGNSLAFLPLLPTEASLYLQSVVSLHRMEFLASPNSKRPVVALV